MHERPGVEIVSDLAKEPSVRVELEQLCRTRAICRANGISSGQNEHLILRSDCDTGNLAQIDARRQLQKIGHRLVANLRRRLSAIADVESRNALRIDDFIEQLSGKTLRN